MVALVALEVMGEQLPLLMPTTLLPMAALAVTAEWLRGQATPVPAVMAAKRPLLDIPWTRVAVLAVPAEWLRGQATAVMVVMVEQLPLMATTLLPMAALAV